MKTLKKVSFIPLLSLVLILLMSWKSDGYLHSNALLNYLEREESISVSHVTNEKIANYFLNKLMIKKVPVYPIHFFYEMHQQGSPYLDANLEVNINGVTQAMLFWDSSGDFYSEGDGYPSYSIQLEVKCPVLDQWEDQGRYHLSIVGHNTTTNQYTTLSGANISLGPLNTPNPNAITRSVSLNCPNYQTYEVYITLTAS